MPKTNLYFFQNAHIYWTPDLVQLIQLALDTNKLPWIYEIKVVNEKTVANALKDYVRVRSNDLKGLTYRNSWKELEKENYGKQRKCVIELIFDTFSFSKKNVNKCICDFLIRKKIHLYCERSIKGYFFSSKKVSELNDKDVVFKNKKRILMHEILCDTYKTNNEFTTATLH
ncbi:hypothetical protein RFI_29579 [Reticulomyxa filosa]|uniref:Uncharacterized protein n=1 Tax=Reticulomyxa filosa TaxID=46433 RepID=X6M450_RETFI|nr:hypothetical protein RFI_29579 [Reticulomyxa filosa]|eukprot:ETO07810.1 hypothetical protein RFI_29579 [Reticulomyxa filosa]